MLEVAFTSAAVALDPKTAVDLEARLGARRIEKLDGGWTLPLFATLARVGVDAGRGVDQVFEVGGNGDRRDGGECRLGGGEFSWRQVGVDAVPGENRHDPAIGRTRHFNFATGRPAGRSPRALLDDVGSKEVAAGLRRTGDKATTRSGGTQHR